jgi:calpain-7
MSLLDDVFDILEAATRHEKAGNRIEAATKYYEATYLMRKVLIDTPQEASDIRRLLEQKIEKYSTAASRLYFDDSSMTPTSSAAEQILSPVSQLSQQSFFQEEVARYQPTNTTSLKSPRLTQSLEANQTASQANAKLARAIELDEGGNLKQAIQSYMESAELYLKAIRLCEDKCESSSIVPVLKRRLGGALDRVEQIKRPKGNKSLSRAHQRNPRVDNDKIKSSSYSKAEIDVLKRSSLIASGIFLPWSMEEAESLSRRAREISGGLRRAAKLHVDSDGDLPISSKQRKHFHCWARPGEIAQMRRNLGHDQKPPVMIRSINPYSIRQQYVTDCSFISSLIITAAFEKKFRKRLITSIIYPQDENGIPVINPEGKYMVKLWLNGVARQVIVDDRLPTDRHSNLLCSHTTGSRDRLELWVSIIEKAYMKLCGGYDFPGSNR